MIPLLETVTAWECPNCTAVHQTTAAQLGMPFHECAGLRGILAPYVQAGTRCQVTATVRDDYVGGEKGLRYDGDGRPVSSVVTSRWDGSSDCAVFPGTASASLTEG